MVVVDTDGGSIGEKEVEAADVAIVAYSCDDQASLDRWDSFPPCLPHSPRAFPRPLFPP